MAQYQVRNKKQAGGRYEFNYGKGKKKLAAVAWNNDVAGGWQIEAGAAGADAVNAAAPYAKLRDLKAAWGEWATEAYGSEEDAEQSESETGSSAPSPSPARPGPPSHRPSLKQQGPPKRPKQGNRPWPVKGTTDPFDPRFRYPSDHSHRVLRGRHTPLAVVIEVWNALDNMPIQHDPALVLIYRELTAVIARECPDLVTENGHVRTPAEAAIAHQQTRKLSRDTLQTAIRGRGADEFDDSVPF